MNRVVQLFRKRSTPQPARDAGATGTSTTPEADPLLAFAAEHPRAGVAPSARPAKAASAAALVQTASSRLAAGGAKPTPRLRRAAWASAIVVLAAAIGSVLWSYDRWIPVNAEAQRPVRFTIETVPAGASVTIDGINRGTAPLSVGLEPGIHSVKLERDGQTRELPITLAAGADVTHHIEFSSSDRAASATGGIAVVTDPPGARVAIDGEARGVSPLALSGLAAREYRVTVSGPSGSGERTVAVTPGAIANTVFALTRSSAPLAGWLAVTAPFDVEIREDDNVIGVGQSSRIMLPAGRHTLTLTNAALQYRETRTAAVTPGETVRLRIDAPKVLINVNARPWADVTLDGVSIGQTPIANVSTSIGPHEIVFRHPELGERRQTVVVASGAPNRITADLTKQEGQSR